MRVRIFDESGRVIKDKKHDDCEDGYYDFNCTEKNAEIYYVKSQKKS